MTRRYVVTTYRPARVGPKYPNKNLTIYISDAETKYGSVYEAFLSAPYSVAAKTGTSQLGKDRTNNGIFICFAPYENPEIAVAIVLEHGNAGSEAAPIARQIMDYYFSFKNSTAPLESDSALLR